MDPVNPPTVDGPIRRGVERTPRRPPAPSAELRAVARRSVLWGVAIAAVLALLAPGSMVGLPSPVDGLVTSGFAGGYPAACSPQVSPPPSAIRIALPNPSTPAPAGSTLGVAYALAVGVTGTAPAGSVTVDVPTLTALVPLANGSTLAVVIGPRALSAPTDTWTADGAATGAHAFGAATAFAGGEAVLSSSLLAVSATTPYGTVTVALRWGWTLTDGGTVLAASGWSTPTAGDGSILVPQEHLTLVDHGPANATAGSAYPVELSGGTPGGTILLKLEGATTGTTVRSAEGTIPADPSTAYVVTISLSGSAGALAPGPFLVHVHGPCGGILYSLPVTITAA